MSSANQRANRRHELLKRGRVLIRGGPAFEDELREIHDELEAIERGTWEPPPGYRIAELVRRIGEHRERGLVVTSVRLSPATRGELANGEPVAELVGIASEAWDKDCDIVEARLPARAGRGRGRR